MEYKIVVCGDGGCGKSALTIKFVQSYFIESYDPTIEDNYRKQVSVDGEVCLMDILDTAGQEEYSAMRDQYMRNGQGFILVYSITSRKTFESIDVFNNQIRRLKDDIIPPMVLAGNKLDLQQFREVTEEEAENYAKNNDMSFHETSAYTGYAVENIFFDLVRGIRRQTVPGMKKTSKNKFKRCCIL